MNEKQIKEEIKKIAQKFSQTVKLWLKNKSYQYQTNGSNQNSTITAKDIVISLEFVGCEDADFEKFEDEISKAKSLNYDNLQLVAIKENYPEGIRRRYYEIKINQI